MHIQAKTGQWKLRRLHVVYDWPKSSVSSLPSFSPVLTHLLGYKLICQHPFSIDILLQGHKHEQTLLLCSPAPFPGHHAGLGRIPEVKQATSPRVSPSSPLLYRSEGKEVSAWKQWEEGHGGCCQPSLDFFWEMSSWTLGAFLDSQKHHYVFCF